MADGSSSNEGDGRRQPRNLQGLLNFCVENTKVEDAPSAGNLTEMSNERKEWLSKAIDGMMADPINEVKKHITNVGIYLGSQHPTDEDHTIALDSLEALFDWCESYDIANDFHKIGGFSILYELMTHSESEFRSHSFKLISVLVQNNPVCQKAVLDDDFLPTMLSVLDSELDPNVQLYAVQAISCLVRDCSLPQAQEQFVARNGFGALKKVLTTQGPFKRVAKVAFFLDVLCDENPQYKDAVCEQGIVELLAQAVKGEHQQHHEQVMRALLCLAKEHPPTQNVLTRSDLAMAQFLQHRLQLLENREENEEERLSAQELLHIIQS